MKTLELPSFEVKIRKEQIFCLVRKKYIALLPEEWVRQHIINLLISHFEYPRGMIKLEYLLKYAKKNLRSDIVTLDSNGMPFLLVECKSFKTKLQHATLNQVAVYNKILQAKYIAISNGLKHHIWKLEDQEYKPITTLPKYPAHI